MEGERFYFWIRKEFTDFAGRPSTTAQTIQLLWLIAVTVLVQNTIEALQGVRQLTDEF